jgi:hypothetical protein
MLSSFCRAKRLTLPLLTAALTGILACFYKFRAQQNQPRCTVNLIKYFVACTIFKVSLQCNLQAT